MCQLRVTRQADLTFGHVPSENICLDCDAAQSDKATPQAHQPLTANTKPSSESPAMTSSLQSAGEIPKGPGGLIHVHTFI